MTDAAEAAFSSPLPPSRCSRRAPCPRPYVRSTPVPYPRRSRVHASPPPGASGARLAWGARRPGAGAGATGWGLRRTSGRPPRATSDPLGEGPPGNPRTGQTSTYYPAYPPPVGLVDLGGIMELTGVAAKNTTLISVTSVVTDHAEALRRTCAVVPRTRSERLPQDMFEMVEEGGDFCPDTGVCATVPPVALELRAA
nr:uncharacterized protein LOC112315351 isoform X2 [Desmodus rotundus]